MILWMIVLRGMDLEGKYGWAVKGTLWPCEGKRRMEKGEEWSVKLK